MNKLLLLLITCHYGSLEASPNSSVYHHVWKRRAQPSFIPETEDQGCRFGPGAKFQEFALPPTSFMLFGGSKEDSEQVFEVFSTKENPISFCPKKIKSGNAFFTSVNRYGAFGIFVDGEALICNGNNGSKWCGCLDSRSQSFQRNPYLDLDVPRSYPASVMLDQQHWWVTGGRMNISNTLFPLSTSLILNPSRGWSPGPNLPDPRLSHCLVRLDEQRFFLVSGTQDRLDNPNDHTRKTFIYQLEDKWSGRWTEQPNLIQGRVGAACSVLEDGGGKKSVIVAGGYNGAGIINSVDLFSLSSLTWSAGPNMLENHHNGVTVGLGSTSMLLLGGRIQAGDYVDWVDQYDHVTSSWRKRPERISIGRAFFGVMAVPENWASKWCR